MTLEIAMVDVTEGDEDAFAEAYSHGRQVIASADGCRSVRMTRGVESPSRFVLLVEWNSLAAHDAFRASDKFGEWRGHVQPYFAVEHFEDIGGGG
jgi:heme-degrading monooxygenase HmoA